MKGGSRSRVYQGDQGKVSAYRSQASTWGFWLREVASPRVGGLDAIRDEMSPQWAIIAQRPHETRLLGAGGSGDRVTASGANLSQLGTSSNRSHLCPQHAHLV